MSFFLSVKCVAGFVLQDLILCGRIWRLGHQPGVLGGTVLPPRGHSRNLVLCLVLHGEGNGAPLQYSCLENPMDWWAAVHGVTKSRTRLSDFPFTFHFHALEKEMATHSSVLAWRIPGTGEPDGLPSMWSHRVRHDWSDLAVGSTVKGIEWVGIRDFKCSTVEKTERITLYPPSVSVPLLDNSCSES